LTDNKNKKRNGSAILRGINKFAFWIEQKIKTGFLGKIFGSYTKENQALEKSFSASALGRRSKLGSVIEKIRFIIAEQFEESRLLSLLRKFIGFFVGCRLRFYGTFFMTFGAYIGLIYFFKMFFVSSVSPSLSSLVISIILILSSVPLLFSKETFAHKIASSKAGHFIAMDILGLSEERMKVPSSRYSDIYNIAIFAGIACGTLSYFIDPLYILGGIFALFAVILIISHPEIGVIGAIASLPFFSSNENTNFLSIIIILYSVGYLIKLICGKRVLNFEIIDLAILFFAIILTLSGPSYILKESSNKTETLLIFLVGAFIAGNLMRTRLWQIRCAFATILSGTLASMIIILKEAVNFANYAAISESLNRIAFFDRKDILSGYLLIALLLVLAGFFNTDGAKKTVVLFMATAIIATAIILLDSFSAWVSVVLAALIFLLIKTKKTVSAVLITGVVASCALSYTYDFLPVRLKTAFDITSVNVYSRLKIWQGSMQLVVASKFGGTGISGFEHFYPIYSVNGFENAEASNALWIRLLSEIGLIGFIIFIFIAFLCIQNCFEYLVGANGKGNIYITASFAAFIGLLIQSLACDFFFNYAFFYAFFAFVSIICATIRSERQEAEKNNNISSNTSVTASILL